MRAGTMGPVAGWVAAAIVLVATTLPAGAAHTAGLKVTVVADHLDNPRGVSIGTGGRVLVAEAGHGDPKGGRCANVLDGGVAEKLCLGFTGAVTVVQGTTVKRVLTKLPSVADPTGSGSTGPSFAQDVAGGKIAVIMQGLMSTTPAAWNPWAKTTFAHLLTNSTPQSSLNFEAYEKAHNPAHDGIESDPYAFALDATGKRGVVADAGANDALLVNNGVISTLAVFPPQTEPDPDSKSTVKEQSVPTSVVAMPDGSYLVGELTGFPYVPGSARIWRVVPGHAPTVWKKGFTNIAGMARGPDGSIYVSEIVKHGLENSVSNAQGGLFRIAPSGAVTEIVVPGLKWAGGVAVASDGSVYIANCSIGLANSSSPCRGQLLKVK